MDEKAFGSEPLDHRRHGLTRRQIITTVLAGCVPWAVARAETQARDELLSDIEWHVLFLTNQQRTWRRVPVLARSDDLAGIARTHSRDMLARGFFDHRSPEGLGPRDRVAREGLRHESCSENLYVITGGPADPAQLASVLVAGWMATSGHRRNILEPAFRYLGVGAAAVGRTVMVTQLFGGQLA